MWRGEKALNLAAIVADKPTVGIEIHQLQVRGLTILFLFSGLKVQIRSLGLWNSTLLLLTAQSHFLGQKVRPGQQFLGRKVRHVPGLSLKSETCQGGVFLCCFLAKHQDFVMRNSISYLYTNKYYGFVQIWQNNGSTGERETWAHYDRRSERIKVSAVLWLGLGF